MGAIGGSDGDGRGTRYEKDLAAAKIADAKWRENQASSGGGVGNAPGGGCLTGMGGCWLVSLIITLVGTLTLLILMLGSWTVKNIASVDIINNYSTAQYFRNIGHMDRVTSYTVNTKRLDCYLDPESIGEKPFRRLKRGETFIYHGYQILDGQTLVAIELDPNEPVYCYLLLPEVWTGKSYWDFGESELLVELVDKDTPRE